VTNDMYIYVFVSTYSDQMEVYSLLEVSYSMEQK